MVKYAQINMETGFVEGETWLTQEVDYPHMILVDEDFDLINKKWDFETETWVEYIPKPIELATPEPTEEELAQAEMLLMQAEILEKLNSIGGVN